MHECEQAATPDDDVHAARRSVVSSPVKSPDHIRTNCPLPSPDVMLVGDPYVPAPVARNTCTARVAQRRTGRADGEVEPTGAVEVTDRDARRVVDRRNLDRGVERAVPGPAHDLHRIRRRVDGDDVEGVIAVDVGGHEARRLPAEGCEARSGERARAIVLEQQDLSERRHRDDGIEIVVAVEVTEHDRPRVAGVATGQRVPHRRVERAVAEPEGGRHVGVRSGTRHRPEHGRGEIVEPVAVEVTRRHGSRHELPVVARRRELLGDRRVTHLQERDAVVHERGRRRAPCCGGGGGRRRASGRHGCRLDHQGGGQRRERHDGAQSPRASLRHLSPPVAHCHRTVRIPTDTPLTAPAPSPSDFDGGFRPRRGRKPPPNIFQRGHDHTGWRLTRRAWRIRPVR